MKTPRGFNVSLKPFLEPKKEPLKSWWAEKDLQEDRAAFRKRLVDVEMVRLCGDQKFGGAKRVLDKFPARQKHAK